MARKLILFLSWSQLVISIAIGMATVVFYMNFQSPLEKVVHSIAAAISAVSSVMTRTAETITAKRELLDQTRQLLSTTRESIEKLKELSDRQGGAFPQYSTSLQSTSKLIERVGKTFKSISISMMFEVPTGIKMNGINPDIVWSKPLSQAAGNLKENAQQLHEISAGLSLVSATFGRDGKALSDLIGRTSAQALMVISNSERTLEQLKAQDLPKAIADLKTTSENLQSVSMEIDRAGKFGIILLIAGLLMSLWCLLNSLSTIALTSAIDFRYSKKPEYPNI